MRSCPSLQCVDDILHRLPLFQVGRRLPYIHFLRLLDKLTAASAVVPLGLLLLRPLQRWLNSLHLDTEWYRHKTIEVSQQRLLALSQRRERAMCLRGERNQVADFLSRHKPPPGEWQLHPEVDLFASEKSTHCPLWFSLMEKTSPLAITLAKRVGELHALSENDSCLRWNSDGSGVPLWPNTAFLPKVLARSYLNQPTQLDL